MTNQNDAIWEEALKAGNVKIIPHERLTPQPAKNHDWKFCDERQTFYHIDEFGKKVFMTEQELQDFNFWLGQYI